MPLGRAVRRVKSRLLQILSKNNRTTPRLSGDAVRDVSAQALGGTRAVGRGTGQIARDVVTGAINAVTEVGGEANEFVRDAVIGVMRGTGDVARGTRPVIRNVVSGAIRGSGEVGADLESASRSAVEGAIRGATSLGITTEEAIRQASQGVVEAVQEAGGELRAAAKAVVGGVIAGVYATGGDVQKVATESARQLVVDAANSGEDIASVAVGAVEGAITASRDMGLESADIVHVVARETIEAAYEISEEIGSAVRERVFDTVNTPRSSFASTIHKRYEEAALRLAEDLERRRGGWRLRALWSAGKTLIGMGGIDLAASLAYFTMLSFFPLIALIVLVFASFADTETVRQKLSEVLLFYFPASEELLNMAIANIFKARLQIGIVALAGMVLGVNGLFMAANRAVNRVFGTRPKRIFGATLTEVVLAVSVTSLFLAALSLTVVFQVALNLSTDIPGLSGPVARVLVLLIRVLSALLPFLLTTLVFAIVYKMLPNREVLWPDAAFGGMIAVFLFELAKNLFFWVTTLTAQRNVLYGTLTSVIILLIWSNLAGVIFLYGASLTRESGKLRPRLRTTTSPTNETQDDPS